jgi:SAM-dependent methyltransferase
MNEKTVIHQQVQERYGQIAANFSPQQGAASCCDTDGGGCCGSDDTALDALYSHLYETDTGWLPETVTGLSLGCGDPLALAALEPGQTVLDLGSGGGIDCFMAARQVGPSGHVIGVDMTPAMLEKAGQNREKLGFGNVEFREGVIEALPVAAETVDVILSNCVINLSPDKTAVFHEAYRVLKPGGRLAVSDMVTLGRFTPEERADMSAWAGCVSGAEDVADYVGWMRDAGFAEVSVRDKQQPEQELAEALPVLGSPRLFSARITAVKPL